MERQPESGQRHHATILESTSAALTAELVRIPRGKSVRPGGDVHILGMHLSRPVNVDCAAGTMRARGLQRPGDMDFVPAGTAGSWEDDAACQILRLTVRPTLLTQVADDLGKDPAKIELVPHLHFRDARIEALLLAIKADLTAPFPSDPLYGEHLAHSLAVRLIEITMGMTSSSEDASSSGLSTRQLAALCDFIDANLDKKLDLATLAAAIGLSVTRLKILFRIGTGSSVHQFVMRRRVDYARTLIATTTTPASEIALAAGFSHQSHMAATMRKVLGLTPKQLERPLSGVDRNR